MMNRRVRRCALLAAVFSVACGSDAGETNDPEATGGSAGGSGSSGSAGSGTAGSSGAAGSAGSAAGATTNGGVGGASGSAGAGGAIAAGTTGDGGGAGDGGMPGLPKRVLLYHFSTLNIPSVSAQLTLLTNQLTAWGYEAKHSVSAADLSAASLAEFGAVGMINTCFEPFGQNKMGEAETAALKSFVEAGGGLFGTHCASVTFQAVEPPHPYNAVIGGRGGHGFFEGMSSCSKAQAHVTTEMLPATFDYTGNLDNADYLAADTTVLLKCKWLGGEQKETAVSWIRTPGKGRVFYTNFAKEDKDLNDATLGPKHILLGLGWVLGR